MEETLQVIDELVNSLRTLQEEYQQEIDHIQEQLESQKNQWIAMSEAIEEKMVHFGEEYSKLTLEIKNSEGVIKALEKELQDNNKNTMLSRKEMKISTTIEDLRVTLERQIEEKDKVIRAYEQLLDSVKMKLNEKISV